MGRIDWRKILPDGWEEMSEEELKVWYMSLDEEEKKAWNYDYRMTCPLHAEVTGHFELTEEDKKKTEEWRNKIMKGEKVI